MYLIKISRKYDKINPKSYQVKLLYRNDNEINLLDMDMRKSQTS